MSAGGRLVGLGDALDRACVRQKSADVSAPPGWHLKQEPEFSEERRRLRDQADDAFDRSIRRSDAVEVMCEPLHWG